VLCRNRCSTYSKPLSTCTTSHATARCENAMMARAARFTNMRTIAGSTRSTQNTTPWKKFPIAGRAPVKSMRPV